MTQFWTVTSRTTGEVLAGCFATPSEGSHPKDNGFPAWNGTTMVAHRIVGTPDPVIQDWTGVGWEASAAKLDAQLITAVKAEAETRKMNVASPGGFKKTEYADKRAEVAGWESLGGSLSAIVAAFNLLPVATREVKFAYAIADAAAFGDQPKDAIARFKAGMASAAAAPRLAAAEARACAAIRAAPTSAAKRAAVAAIVWPA